MEEKKVGNTTRFSREEGDVTSKVFMQARRKINDCEFIADQYAMLNARSRSGKDQIDGP